jgi:hypothetical protein
LLNREDGPAIITDTYEEWWQNNLRHRIGGPAIFGNGREEWWFEGKLHRIDGPAVIRPGKKKGIHKEWWIDGKLIHIEFSNGSNKWFLNGIRVPVKTQIEYDQYILTNITQR